MEPPGDYSKEAERQHAARFTGLTQVDCAAVLDISARHFRKLLDQGVFSDPGGHANYELRTVVREWTKYIEQGRSPTDIAQAKKRDAMAAARLKEAKAEQLEGRLLDFDDTRNTVTQMAVRLAASLDGIAGRVAAELVAAIGGDRAKVRDIVFREHRKVREEMARSLEALVEDPIPPIIA